MADDDDERESGSEYDELNEEQEPETEGEIDGEEEEEEHSVCDDCNGGPGVFGVIVDCVKMVYTTKYYWDIFKSTLIFMLAWKMTRESRKMVIPLKYHVPFNNMF